MAKKPHTMNWKLGKSIKRLFHLHHYWSKLKDINTHFDKQCSSPAIWQATQHLFLPEKMTDTSHKGDNGHSHVPRTWELQLSPLEKG